MPTPPLHFKFEYALDLVDALKAREEVGSAFGVGPLDLLEFTTIFTRPMDEAIADTLSRGARRVMVHPR